MHPTKDDVAAAAGDRYQCCCHRSLVWPPRPNQARQSRWFGCYSGCHSSTVLRWSRMFPRAFESVVNYLVSLFVLPDRLPLQKHVLRAMYVRSLTMVWFPTASITKIVVKQKKSVCVKVHREMPMDEIPTSSMPSIAWCTLSTASFVRIWDRSTAKYWVSLKRVIDITALALSSSIRNASGLYSKEKEKMINIWMQRNMRAIHTFSRNPSTMLASCSPLCMACEYAVIWSAVCAVVFCMVRRCSFFCSSDAVDLPFVEKRRSAVLVTCSSWLTVRRRGPICDCWRTVVEIVGRLRLNDFGKNVTVGHSYNCGALICMAYRMTSEISTLDGYFIKCVRHVV